MIKIGFTHVLISVTAFKLHQVSPGLY